MLKLTKLSRSEARAAGQRTYATGRPCSKGHVAERWVGNGTCVVCARNACQNYKARTPSARYYPTDWAEKNPDRSAEIKRASYERNRESYLRRAAEWRETNPDRMREYKRAYRERHPERLRALRAARRRTLSRFKLTKGQREWMHLIYETCPEGWHVDHIVPLQGENVCGLHVPWNLQHLPALINQAKGNRT